MKNIIFCFPYRGVGGVSLLFLRMAEYIVSKVEVNVYCIDYEDGFISAHIKDSRVSVLSYSDEVSLVVPEKSLIVFQLMTPWSIFPNLIIPVDCKVFFWGCHPYNLVPHVPIFDKLLKKNRLVHKWVLKTLFYPYWLKSKRFLDVLSKYDALAFMDSPNRMNAEWLYMPLYQDGFLPIPALNGDARIGHVLVEPLHLFWVGRIVDFKYHILSYTLNQVNEYAKLNNKKIEFTIVGDGDYLDQLKIDCAGYSYFEINFIDCMSTNDLEEFMSDNVDLVFAMGTSALESAKLAIPTVLLDVAYNSVRPGYQFTFLHRGDGATLGNLIDSDFFAVSHSDDISSMESLSDIFSVLESDYDSIANATRSYFYDNHSMEKVSKIFLERIYRSSLPFGELQRSKCLTKGLFYTLKKKFKL